MIIEDEELRSLYKEASADHIQKIESGLLHLEKNPQDQAQLEHLLRETHSLKGDSRMLGVKDAETLTHQLEDILGAVKRGERVLTPPVMNCLYQGLDALRKIAHEAVTGQSAGISVFHVLAQLMGADSGEALPEVQETIAQSNGAVSAQATVEQPLAGNDAPPAADALTQVNNYQIDTIRVESQKLDKLLTQASELVVTKGHIEDRVAEIDRIIALCEEWNREAFASRLTYDEVERRLQTPELQPLQNFYNLVETRLEQLEALLNRLRSTSYEDNTKLETVANELESGIHSLRLLPFSTIFNLFPRTVRDIAKQQGKEVNLILEGSDTSVDKRILEEMKDPLLHLLRNAIDHGIETPTERQSLGKSPTATIRLRGYQVGSTVSIEVMDDGRGLDVEAIKGAAGRRGIRTKQELAEMSTAEIQALIFAPGFSTRTAVTEISGRGVGLDVVRANVERLKGNIQVEFTPSKGCLFRITLSSSLSTTDALIIQVSEHSYAIPVGFVEAMQLVSPQEVFASGGSQTLPFQGESVTVTWLADLLGLPVKPPASTKALCAASKTIPCIILRIGSERLAVLVDTILEQQDIVLKPQSLLLKRVRNISGATILGTGEVCMVLNPPDLFKSARKAIASVTVKELTEQAQVKQKILLVEDSIPIRTQMKRILESAGYEVTAAVDGEDGFKKLRVDSFVAVVSDVQMPNLDGLELTVKIRQFQEYKDLPVILVTTLASQKDKDQGHQAGANAYITKGDFEQGVLLDTLRSLI
ncbi:MULTISPECIES: hybrid sensor histidine kinase/response regulator [unclassified Coleofasciculus]|uniref:hybrid sensor histidine kinase/response regulator n=1 Tax=unclassified Coleofasciculus TaxID=2692782 RepID=UPI0018816A83|nr:MULTISPECIES: hybrid sensor histidine kinase/response regulator [unclassified Coleofasciculus]MBE9126286.1 hybrid sensor histidine kinase/response regulator [Coleofasciculus sp. LEGE 07081]MBE9149205.1 hybrid sensor histidine kinase/response regulator [Coleofasciculus sp. LEGE 07092]